MATITNNNFQCATYSYIEQSTIAEGDQRQVESANNANDQRMPDGEQRLHSLESLKLQLMRLGLIDERGRIVCDKFPKELPAISHSKVAKLKKLLKMPLQFKNGNGETITITLHELMDKLHKYCKERGIKEDVIEIVGSAVTYILGANYIYDAFVSVDLRLKEFLKTEFLSTFQRPPSDLDIRYQLPEVNDNDIDGFNHVITTFITEALQLQEQKKNLRQVIQKSNYFFDGANAYTIARISPLNYFSVELLGIKNLKRLNLFDLDALRFVILKLGKEKISLAPQLRSSIESPWQVLVDKLLKLIHTANFTGLNSQAWFTYVSLLSKGYRCVSLDIERALLAALNLPGNLEPCPGKYLASQMRKALGNHNQANPVAALAMAFNGSQMLLSHEMLDNAALDNFWQCSVNDEQSSYLQIAAPNKFTCHEFINALMQIIKANSNGSEVCINNLLEVCLHLLDKLNVRNKAQSIQLTHLYHNERLHLALELFPSKADQTTAFLYVLRDEHNFMNKLKNFAKQAHANTNDDICKHISKLWIALFHDQIGKYDDIVLINYAIQLLHEDQSGALKELAICILAQAPLSETSEKVTKKLIMDIAALLNSSKTDISRIDFWKKAAFRVMHAYCHGSQIDVNKLDMALNCCVENCNQGMHAWLRVCVDSGQKKLQSIVYSILKDDKSDCIVTNDLLEHFINVNAITFPELVLKVLNDISKLNTALEASKKEMLKRICTTYKLRNINTLDDHTLHYLLWHIIQEIYRNGDVDVNNIAWLINTLVGKQQEEKAFELFIAAMGKGGDGLNDQFFQDICEVCFKYLPQMQMKSYCMIYHNSERMFFLKASQWWQIALLKMIEKLSQCETYRKSDEWFHIYLFSGQMSFHMDHEGFLSMQKQMIANLLVAIDIEKLGEEYLDRYNNVIEIHFKGETPDQIVAKYSRIMGTSIDAMYLSYDIHLKLCEHYLSVNELANAINLIHNFPPAIVQHFLPAVLKICDSIFHMLAQDRSQYIPQQLIKIATCFAGVNWLKTNGKNFLLTNLEIFAHVFRQQLPVSQASQLLEIYVTILAENDQYAENAEEKFELLLYALENNWQFQSKIQIKIQEKIFSALEKHVDYFQRAVNGLLCQIASYLDVSDYATRFSNELNEGLLHSIDFITVNQPTNTSMLVTADGVFAKLAAKNQLNLTQQASARQMLKFINAYVSLKMVNRAEFWLLKLANSTHVADSAFDILSYLKRLTAYGNSKEVFRVLLRLEGRFSNHFDDVIGIVADHIKSDELERNQISYLLNTLTKLVVHESTKAEQLNKVIHDTTIYHFERAVSAQKSIMAICEIIPFFNNIEKCVWNKILQIISSSNSRTLTEVVFDRFSHLFFQFNAIDAETTLAWSLLLKTFNKNCESLALKKINKIPIQKLMQASISCSIDIQYELAAFFKNALMRCNEEKCQADEIINYYSALCLLAQQNNNFADYFIGIKFSCLRLLLRLPTQANNLLPFIAAEFMKRLGDIHLTKTHQLDLVDDLLKQFALLQENSLPTAKKVLEECPLLPLGRYLRENQLITSTAINLAALIFECRTQVELSDIYLLYMAYLNATPKAKLSMKAANAIIKFCERAVNDEKSYMMAIRLIEHENLDAIALPEKGYALLCEVIFRGTLFHESPWAQKFIRSHAEFILNENNNIVDVLSDIGRSVGLEYIKKRESEQLKNQYYIWISILTALGGADARIIASRRKGAKGELEKCPLDLIFKREFLEHLLTQAIDEEYKRLNDYVFILNFAFEILTEVTTKYLSHTEVIFSLYERLLFSTYGLATLECFIINITNMNILLKKISHLSNSHSQKILELYAAVGLCNLDGLKEYEDKECSALELRVNPQVLDASFYSAIVKKLSMDNPLSISLPMKMLAGLNYLRNCRQQGQIRFMDFYNLFHPMIYAIKDHVFKNDPLGCNMRHLLVIFQLLKLSITFELKGSESKDQKYEEGKFLLASVYGFFLVNKKFINLNKHIENDLLMVCDFILKPTPKKFLPQYAIQFLELFLERLIEDFDMSWQKFTEAKLTSFIHDLMTNLGNEPLAKELCQMREKLLIKWFERVIAAPLGKQRLSIYLEKFKSSKELLREPLYQQYLKRCLENDSAVPFGLSTEQSTISPKISSSSSHQIKTKEEYIVLLNHLQKVSRNGVEWQSIGEYLVNQSLLKQKDSLLWIYKQMRLLIETNHLFKIDSWKNVLEVFLKEFIYFFRSNFENVKLYLNHILIGKSDYLVERKLIVCKACASFVHFDVNSYCLLELKKCWHEYHFDYGMQLVSGPGLTFNKGHRKEAAAIVVKLAPWINKDRSDDCAVLKGFCALFFHANIPHCIQLQDLRGHFNAETIVEMFQLMYMSMSKVNNEFKIFYFVTFSIFVGHLKNSKDLYDEWLKKYLEWYLDEFASIGEDSGFKLYYAFINYNLNEDFSIDKPKTYNADYSDVFIKLVCERILKGKLVFTETLRQILAGELSFILSNKLQTKTSSLELVRRVCFILAIYSPMENDLFLASLYVASSEQKLLKINEKNTIKLTLITLGGFIKFNPIAQVAKESLMELLEEVFVAGQTKGYFLILDILAHIDNTLLYEQNEFKIELYTQEIKRLQPHLLQQNILRVHLYSHILSKLLATCLKVNDDKYRRQCASLYIENVCQAIQVLAEEKKEQLVEMLDSCFDLIGHNEIKNSFIECYAVYLQQINAIGLAGLKIGNEKTLQKHIVKISTLLNGNLPKRMTRLEKQLRKRFVDKWLEQVQQNQPKQIEYAKDKFSNL